MKPIAKINQYPYTIGGISVSGAKINGSTYTADLYILQQRSDLVYDLISSSGEVFTFIEVTWRNENGQELNYYTDNSTLVSTIPNNTFFWKVQDPRENIYGFMTLIQLNKIKVNTGKYIYRNESEEVELTAVRLSPSFIQSRVGDIIEIDIDFEPSYIANKKGKWIISNGETILDNIPSLNTSTKQFYECTFEGAAYVIFVPDANMNLSGSSTVVVSGSEPVLQNYIMYEKNINTNNHMYESGGWYYPGSIVEFALTPKTASALPPKMSYTMMSKETDITQWVTEIENDDPLLYQFKIKDELPLPPYDSDSSPYRWTVTVTFTGEEQTFEFVLYVSHFVSVNSELYVVGQSNLRIGYDTTFVLSRGKPQYGAAWVIGNTDIATVSSDGVVTPLSEGSTYLRCYHANPDGTPNLDSAYNESPINVYTNIPLSVKYFPNDRFTYEVGEEIQYTYETYPEGSDFVGTNSWGIVGSSTVASISETGLLTVKAASEYNGNIVYSNAIFTALQPNRVVASNNTYDSSFSITTVAPGTVIKPVSYSFNSLVDGVYGIIPIQNTPSILSISMTPYWVTGSKITNIVVEDTTVIEIQYDEYYMNAAPAFELKIKGLKPGRSNITFSPKETPELVITKTIYVV